MKTNDKLSLSKVTGRWKHTFTSGSEFKVSFNVVVSPRHAVVFSLKLSLCDVCENQSGMN